ncbi:MAG: fasciclin domain-containing protein [Bacteroidota bacterium]
MTKHLTLLAILAFMLAPLTSLNAQAQDADEAPANTVVDVAVANNFNTLVAALEAADLVEALRGAGPFTVLAPTDEAFAKLPEGTLESLLLPENKDQLTAILMYHVIPAEAMAEQVVTMDTAPTLQGASLTITASEAGQVMINEANVVMTDVAASNGVVHVIDTVLLPPSDGGDN